MISVVEIAKIIFKKTGGIDWKIKESEVDFDRKVEALILAEAIYKKIKETKNENK